MLRRIVRLIIIIIFISACGNEEYTPKPEGYFRINLPDTSGYEGLDINCPYRFAMNENANWINKKNCWGDIYYPSIKARIQLTYKNVGNNLDSLLYDGHTLAFKHTVRADGIEERLFVDAGKKIYGILYKIKGDAATSTQFYMTDSTEHFLRGVLYIYAPPNADSLRPVNDYMYSETLKLIESLEWK